MYYKNMNNQDYNNMTTNHVTTQWVCCVNKVEKQILAKLNIDFFDRMLIGE